MTHSRPFRPECMATRTRITLALGTSYSRAQLAYLMAQASRWGAEEAYERGRLAGIAQEAERQAELRVAAMLTPEIPWSAAALARADDHRRSRATVRAEVEALRQVPVLVGYHGGAVPEWDLGPERATRAERVSTRLAALPEIRMTPSGEWQ